MCMDRHFLCDGHAHCPGAEDESSICTCKETFQAKTNHTNKFIKKTNVIKLKRN